MSTFNQLKTFVTIVEQQGFNKAAKILNQSTSTTSRQLSELEERLGNNLILRNTKGLALTEFGELYFQEASALLNSFERLENMAVFHKKDPEGHLKILGPTYALNEYVLPFLAEFMALYPKIIPVLEFDEKHPDLHREDIDICISVDRTIEQSESNTRDIVKRHIFEVNFVLCCSSEYAKQFGVPQTLEDLTGHSFITHTIRPNPKLIMVKNASISIEPRMYVNNGKAMVTCAKNHIGIIQCIAKYIDTYIKSGELIEILPEYQTTANFCIYYKKIRYLEPKVAKFIEFFLKRCEVGYDTTNI